MIACAVLTCHAPIVVPEVGGRRSEQCATTTSAMIQVAERVLAHEPDVLVVLSPHTPRHRTAWAIRSGERLQGTFARFGRPDVGVDLPVAEDAVSALHAAAHDRAVSTWVLEPEPLDHGALVPLHFLARAGWAGPTVLTAIPSVGLDPDALGSALAAASEGQRWGIVASGDMSHRLKEGAPAGFHPDAHQFDEAFVACLDGKDLRSAAALPRSLRQIAAEDVVDTTAIASAAVGWRSDGLERLAYEAPFGVGYCEAVLFSSSPAAQHTPDVG